MSSTRIALYGDSYISRLAHFCDYDLKVPGEVCFFDKDGMTVENQDRQMYAALIAFRPDVVIVNLGGSDISSKSKPGNIIKAIFELVDSLKENGINTVYVAEICERGYFTEDRSLTQKSFNAQRKKINNCVSKNTELRYVKLKMKFPKDHDQDLVLSLDGLNKLFFTLRRVIFQHKVVKSKSDFI